MVLIFVVISTSYLLVILVLVSPSCSSTFISFRPVESIQVGEGALAAGLTTYVAKNPETGETVLESRALVLSDRGICCIDEFDKMFDSARSMMHEVMEQQTVSIAKVRCNPLAKSTLFYIKNNDFGIWKSGSPLIYLILDKPDEQTDRRLAKHVVALHFENAESAQEEALEVTTLTTYVSYARKNIHPKLSDEAAEEVTRGYVELRKAGKFVGSSKKRTRCTCLRSIFIEYKVYMTGK